MRGRDTLSESVMVVQADKHLHYINIGTRVRGEPYMRTLHLMAGFHIGFSSRGARTIVIIQVFYTGFFISKGYS